MADNDLLIVKSKPLNKMQFKVVQKKFNNWSEPKYKFVIKNKDATKLASVFCDLNSIGFPIKKAYEIFKRSYLGDKEDILF